MSVSAAISSLLGNSQSQAARSVSASMSDDGSTVDSSTSLLTEGNKDSLFTDKTSGLSEDDFLKLLMTELQNQDPSSPMDNAQMMSQMAQLEAIQSNNNMEKAIKEMSGSFQSSVSAQNGSAQSMTNATSVSLIGKTVRIKESELSFSGAVGEKMTVRVNLGSNKAADVRLLDGDGNVVRTLTATNKDGTNAATVTWDGKTEDGTYAPAGTYTIKIAGQEDDASLYAFEEDVVQGVSFSSTGAKLKVAGKELSVANVMDVAKEVSASGFGALSTAQAMELLGKEVRVKRETISFSAQAPDTQEFKVNANPSSTVKVAILDSEGNPVALFSKKADDKGCATFEWDGTSSDGKYLDTGKYTIKVDGADKNPSLYCYDNGTVDGVNTVGGGSKIRVNGKEYSLADILDISTKAGV
jgi:flagellar basal-body rod modification protein FlgD